MNTLGLMLLGFFIWAWIRGWSIDKIVEAIVVTPVVFILLVIMLFNLDGWLARL